MKKILFSFLLLEIYISAGAQVSRTDLLQDLEKNQSGSRNVTVTVKIATRLFADNQDLTSVITIIPSGSTVNVTGYDSTFLQVDYEGNKGYIYSSHATKNKPPVSSLPADPQVQQMHREMAARQEKQSTRLSNLIRKYGVDIAGKIYNGKIWKGMTSEMVQDSWGSPRKISRVISGNNVKEEWTYRNTCLYMQNNVLSEWGLLKQ